MIRQTGPTGQTGQTGMRGQEAERQGRQRKNGKTVHDKTDGQNISNIADSLFEAANIEQYVQLNCASFQPVS
jgi:hypothetical protein